MATEQKAAVQANTTTTSPGDSAPPSPVGNAAMLIAQEVINYFGFLLRVPVAICFAAMVLVILVVLQDVYPAVSGPVNLAVLTWLPDRVHLEGHDFIRLYGILSTVLYAISLVGRLILRDRLPRPGYRTKFTVAAVVATLGWGFVLYNVQYVRVAAGTSRVSIGVMFFVFYLVTLVAFAAALGLSRLADVICGAGAGVLQRAATPGTR